MTVDELRTQVIESGILEPDAKGIYRMPNGSLVSKAKKADLEALLQNAYAAALVPMESTVPVITAKGIVPESENFSERISRCLKRAYWDSLDKSAQESHAYFVAKGDEKKANEMLTRSLSQALAGNDGI